MIWFTAIGMTICMWAIFVVHSREVINGDGLVEHYLVRHTLLRLPNGIAVYWHHYTHDDWSLDVHDHPKGFISIGVRGEYVEETINRETGGRSWRHFKAPWIRYFPPSHAHRLMMLPLPPRRQCGEQPRPCWTIAITGPLRSDWGFLVPINGTNHRVWIDWKSYVYGAIARQRRAR